MPSIQPVITLSHLGLTWPDGDVALSDAAIQSFRYVGCAACGGRLKPDVVFFGENVPKPRVEASYETVERARALVVLGSSLTGASGFRFVRQAHRAGVPVVIVNRGSTRGDDLATVKLEWGCTEFLTSWVELVETERLEKLGDREGQSARRRIVEGSAASFSTVDSASGASTSITA